MKGAIRWVELRAGDLEESGRFYERIFGWKIGTEGHPRYRVFQDSTGEVWGGFFTDVNCAGDQGITFYINVASIEETLAKVREAGCEILKERTEVHPDGGFHAAFRDIAGNAIALWEEGSDG